jgi:hypothetical protein
VVPPIPPTTKGDNLLNAAVTGIKTRNPVLLKLLELAVKLAGGTLRYWRSRPRLKKVDPPNTIYNSGDGTNSTTTDASVPVTLT